MQPPGLLWGSDTRLVSFFRLKRRLDKWQIYQNVLLRKAWGRIQWRSQTTSEHLRWKTTGHSPQVWCCWGAWFYGVLHTYSLQISKNKSEKNNWPWGFWDRKMFFSPYGFTSMSCALSHDSSSLTWPQGSVWTFGRPSPKSQFIGKTPGKNTGKRGFLMVLGEKTQENPLFSS